MQTILGAGGAIGTELAKILPTYSDPIRLVSRNPKQVNPADQLLAADLTNMEDTQRAVAGSRVVYLTAGFNYNTKNWQTTWPVVMKNVIDACAEAKAKLVFFDNIYMYSADAMGNITEDAPIDPPSKKGKVRAEIAEMLLEAHRTGKIIASIARSADFYGPNIAQTSMLTETVIKPLQAGKKANWLSGLHHQHSFTFTPDAARATALLGNTATGDGEAWHLPTAPFPLTGQQWVELIAKELNVAPRVQVAPKFLVRLLGLFNPLMGELVEMMYQYDRDYIFNSEKFERTFDMKATPYTEGIQQVIQAN